MNKLNRNFVIMLFATLVISKCCAWQYDASDNETITVPIDDELKQYYVPENATVTFKQSGNAESTVQIFVAPGATIILKGVNFSIVGSPTGNNCIKCNGSATIILADGSENIVSSSSQGGSTILPGPVGSTLTIKGQEKGTGRLIVSAGQYGPAIGSNYVYPESTLSWRGNIVIDGGIIRATGGTFAPGIGTSRWNSSIGDIIIRGGDVTAIGNGSSAGIGTGEGETSCGNILIEDTITKVAATKGASATGCIGKGAFSSLVQSRDIADSIRQSYSNDNLTLILDPTYTIMWQNEDGTVLENDANVVRNETPIYNGATPQKAFTGRYVYEFLEWQPSIEGAVSNTIYKAKFHALTAQNYTEWAVARGYGGSNEKLLEWIICSDTFLV